MPFAFRRLADRLAVGHLRLADVRLHLELAPHAVDDDLQVQLAHAGDDGLAGLLVGVTRKVGSSSASVLQRHAHACPGPPCVFGSMAMEMTGSGNSIVSSDDRVRRSHSVSPVVSVLQAHCGGDVAGADLVDLLAVVGVHQQDAADALVALRWSALRT